MGQSSRLGSPNDKALAMASDGTVSDNRQDSMASDGLFGEVDPIPFVGESKAIALATLGIIASSKSVSMASLGLFGVSSPTPPTPTPSGTVVNMSPMLSTIGKLM